MRFGKTVLLFLLFFSINIFSQSKFNVGGSFNIGFPVGDFSDLVKTAIGGSINSEYRFNEKISATLGVFYHSYNSEIPKVAIGGSTYDFSVEAIPVVAGVRYYFNPTTFGIVEAGAHFMRITADVYLGEDLSTDYKTKFGAGLGVGYRIRIADPSVFELSAVYQYVQDNLSSVSLRATVLILLGNLN